MLSFLAIFERMCTRRGDFKRFGDFFRVSPTLNLHERVKQTNSVGLLRTLKNSSYYVLTIVNFHLTITKLFFFF